MSRPRRLNEGYMVIFSQEIFASWIDDRQGSEAIPQVIERKIDLVFLRTF